MSDEDTLDDANVDDEGYVAPVPPTGYIPGLAEEELPAGQNVGDRGEVIPPPEEILEVQREAAESAKGGGGASPDTAAAGAEHEDR